jgi:hypothetical protein
MSVRFSDEAMMWVLIDYLFWDTDVVIDDDE